MKTIFDEKRALIDIALSECLNNGQDFFGAELLNIIRWTVLAKGQRLRPLMLLTTHEAMGGTPELVLNAACATEILHASSLILDDFMDNARIRRGRQTLHSKYGIELACLASVSMQFYALKLLFENIHVLSETKRLACDADCTVAYWLYETVSKIISGQFLDLHGKPDSREDVLRVYELKTGVAFEFAASLGGYFAGGSSKEIDTLAKFGKLFGIAYQLRDDLTDLGIVELQANKDLLKDIGKFSFVSLWGVNITKVEIERLSIEILTTLDELGNKRKSLDQFLELFKFDEST